MSVPLTFEFKSTGAQKVEGDLNRVSQSLNQQGKAAQQAGGMWDRLGQTFTAKRALIFSMSGIVASGVEAIGMFSLLADSQEKVTKLTNELNQMEKEGAQGTKEYADTVRELEGAQRALRFQLRLTVLSAFDLLPFTINLISAMVRMRVESKLAALEAKNVAASTTIQTEAIAANTAAKLTNTGATAANAAANRIMAGSMVAGVAPLAGITTGATKSRDALMGLSTAIGAGGLATQMPKAQSGLQKFLGFFKGKGGIITVVGVTAVSAIIAFQDELKAAAGGLINFLKGIPVIGGLIETIFPQGRDVKVIDKEEQKRIDEMRKSIEELHKSSSSFFNELVAAEKDDKKSILSAIGIKGEGKDDFKDVSDPFEKMVNRLRGFGDTLKFIEQGRILEQLNIGFEIPQETWDSIGDTWAKRFQKMASKTGNTMFDELSIIFAQLGENQDPQMFLTALGQLAIEHPELIKLLEGMGLGDIAATVTGIMNEQVDEIKKKNWQDVISGAIFNPNPVTQGKVTPEEVNKLSGKKDQFGNDFISQFPSTFGKFLGGTKSPIERLNQILAEAGIGTLPTSITWDDVMTALGLNDTGWATQAATWFQTHIGVPIATGWGTMVKNVQAAFTQIGTAGLTIANTIDQIINWTFGGGLLTTITNLAATASAWFQTNVGAPIATGWGMMISTFTSAMNQIGTAGLTVALTIDNLINWVFGGGLLTVLTNFATATSKWFTTNVGVPVGMGWGTMVKTFFEALNAIGTAGVGLAITIDDIIGWIFGATFVQDLGNIVTQAATWFRVNIVDPIAVGIGEAIGGIGAALDAIIGGFTGGDKDVKTSGGEGQIKFLDDPIAWILQKLGFAASASTPEDTTAQTIPTIITLTVDDTAAGQKLTAVGQTILGLGNLMPQINLQTDTAGTALSSVASTIVGLQNLQPQINLQNQEALNTIATTGQRIADLETLEPQIMLQNDEALDAVQEVEDEIMDLENLNPTVTVKVKTEGAKSKGDFIDAAGFAKGGLISAARGKLWTAHGEQLFRVADNAGGMEDIAFIPHNDPYPTIEKILNKFGGSQNVSLGDVGVPNRNMGGGGGDATLFANIYIAGQKVETIVTKIVRKNLSSF
jgi:hypothetical protein